jgi:hypothetical protein
MVRYLRRLEGKQIRLEVGAKTYFGEIVVERRPESPVKNKYYFQTNHGEGKRIPIFHYGKRRVIMKDGGLVQLITKDK